MPRFLSRRNNVPIMHMCDSEIKLTFWLICMQQEKQHTMCKYTFGVGFTPLPAVVVKPIVLWVKLERNNKCQVRIDRCFLLGVTQPLSHERWWCTTMANLTHLTCDPLVIPGPIAMITGVGSWHLSLWCQCEEE